MTGHLPIIRLKVDDVVTLILQRKVVVTKMAAGHAEVSFATGRDRGVFGYLTRRQVKSIENHFFGAFVR